MPTKLSTEAGDASGFFKNRDFVASVKFLRVEDSFDKFLSGLPLTHDFFGQPDYHDFEDNDK